MITPVIMVVIFFSRIDFKKSRRTYVELLVSIGLMAVRMTSCLKHTWIHHHENGVQTSASRSCWLNQPIRITIQEMLQVSLAFNYDLMPDLMVDALLVRRTLDRLQNTHWTWKVFAVGHVRQYKSKG